MADRASPEEILKRIKDENLRQNRGHLKIFFGYAAGVGKTYAMLKAAHAAKRRGVDVVAGYIEPHARPQTKQLLNGLEALPTMAVEHKSITLNEFDLDAALKRRPKLILVDELAHTNSEYCRHTKRYQDVEELLNAGIDV
ncbi:MAG: histidine kinase, partial [Oscillospiraceae bacterium]